MARRDSKPQGGQRRPHGQRPDRPGEKQHGEKQRGPKQHGPKQNGSKPFGAKPHGSKPHGAKPHGAKPHDSKPHGPKSHGPKSHGPKSHDSKPQGQKPHGPRQQSFKPQVAHPRGPKQRPATPASRAPVDRQEWEEPPQRAERAGRPERDHAAPERSASRVETWIYGYHPAAAALANPARKILRVVATPESADRLRSDPSVPADMLSHMRILAKREIDQLVGEEAVHQGVAVLARPLDHHLQDVLNALEHREDVCLVLLDQVTDPHNVGAILRSAAAFGASAVIAPDRHAPEETGVMAKSASGALDKVPYVKTVNLVRAIEILKEARFWLVGLEADAGASLADIDLKGRIALVLGAEGEGIRRLVAEACDHRARLPIASAMESLNVSNAAAVALYEKARQITAKRK